MKNNSTKFRLFITFVFSIMALLFFSFYNGYPLIFNNDTAAYLECAFYNYSYSDRPPAYGYLMYFVSVAKSLWFVVLAQSIIVAYVVLLFFKNHVKSINRKLYLGLILTVSLFMGGSLEASWLMPDVFTGIGILCLGLLLFYQNLKLIDWLVLVILLMISIAVHNSHVYIYMGILLLLLVGWFFRVSREFYKYAGLKVNNFLELFVIVIVIYIGITTINYLNFGKGTNSRGGQVFLFANMVEMGLIDEYLAENCSSSNFTICQYKDSIPNNFLWEANSPIHKNGGWNGNEDEYSFIVKDILSNPKYLFPFIRKGVFNSLKQFFRFEIGYEINKSSERVDSAINKFYPIDYFYFYHDKQNNNKLKFQLINYTQKIIFSLSLLFYVYILFYRKSAAQIKLLLIFIVVALVVNAIVCGVFSGVYARYQSRVVWLLPLPIFLYFSQVIAKNRVNNKIKSI